MGRRLLIGSGGPTMSAPGREANLADRRKGVLVVEEDGSDVDAERDEDGVANKVAVRRAGIAGRALTRRGVLAMVTDDTIVFEVDETLGMIMATCRLTERVNDDDDRWLRQLFVEQR